MIGTAARGWAQRVPLRVLLVAAMLLVVLTGLVASSAAVTVTMRGQLVQHVDEQLQDAAKGWAHRGPRMPPVVGADGPTTRRPPSQFYVRIETADGSGTYVVNDLGSTPAVPASPPTSEPFTVHSADGNGDWRLLAVDIGDGDVAVIGLPLAASVDHTVNQLMVVQALVGAVVLVLVGAGGWVLIRRALRPLEDVEQTAGEIAAGNLDRRLPERPAGTEVGNLSRSFNEMITRIQGAFASTAASEAAARRSEDRMRRFVADASHELRTPLTSIRGFAELYRSGMLPDAEQAVGRIESEAGRMSDLVEDLLTLARLDAERPMDRTPVDLADVASDAVAAARAIDPERSLVLTLDAVPVVQGDAGRIRQVVSNLVVNAIRHAGPGASVWVTVGAEPAPGDAGQGLGEGAGGGIPGDHDGAGVGKPDGNPDEAPADPAPRWAVLTVADDGRGMSAEDAGRVFERFHRADDSRSRGSGGGSGLGLSIVEGIVRAHGGTIELSTAPDQGARFVVRLPAG